MKPLRLLPLLLLLPGAAAALPWESPQAVRSCKVDDPRHLWDYLKVSKPIPLTQKIWDRLTPEKQADVLSHRCRGAQAYESYVQARGALDSASARAEQKADDAEALAVLKESLYGQENRDLSLKIRAVAEEFGPDSEYAIDLNRRFAKLNNEYKKQVAKAESRNAEASKGRIADRSGTVQTARGAGTADGAREKFDGDDRGSADRAGRTTAAGRVGAATAQPGSLRTAEPKVNADAAKVPDPRYTPAEQKYIDDSNSSWLGLGKSAGKLWDGGPEERIKNMHSVQSRCRQDSEWCSRTQKWCDSGDFGTGGSKDCTGFGLMKTLSK